MKIILVLFLLAANSYSVFAQIYTNNLIIYIPIHSSEVNEIQNNLEINLGGTDYIEIDLEKNNQPFLLME